MGTFEEYRLPFETGPHWELKREFLEFYKDNFTEDRLLCLAQAYSNIVLMQCSYPKEVMIQILELSKPLKGCKRFAAGATPQSKDKNEKQRGKRSSSGSSGSDNLKFIKFCPGAETPAPLPKSFQKHCNYQTPITAIVDAIDYQAINKSKDTEVIHKIAEEVQKNPYSKRCSIDVIFDAAENLKLKDFVNLISIDDVKCKKTNAVTYCELFIGTTRIAVGKGNCVLSARQKAARLAHDAMLQINSLPRKTLEQVKNQAKRETVSMKAQVDKKASTQSWSKKVTESQSKSDLDFLEKLAFIIKQHLKSLKILCAVSVLNNSCGKLKIADDCVFNFSEGLNEAAGTYFCEFTVKNITVGQGKGLKKRFSKQDAAEKAIKNLLSLLDSGDDEIPESEKWYAEIIRDRPPVGTTKSKKSKKIFGPAPPDSKKSKNESDPAPSDSKKIKKESDPAPSDSNQSKRESDPAPSSSKDSDDEFDFGGDITDDIPKYIPRNHNEWRIPTPPPNQPFVLNQKMYENSINEQFLLFDKTDVDRAIPNPNHIISISSHQCRKSFEYNYELNDDGSYSADCILDKKIIGSGFGPTKAKAKEDAAKNVLRVWRKLVYSVKVKVEKEEGFHVNRNDMLNLKSRALKAVSEDNIGCKMLKMMGWSGGGIGKKKGGITEPISAEDHSCGRGLGYKSKDELIKNWKYMIESILQEFSTSDAVTPLIFSADFSTPERAQIHKLANKYNLANRSYGKGEQRQLYIRRKIPVTDLLQHIVRAGGKTNKYELVDMSMSDK